MITSDREQWGLPGGQTAHHGHISEGSLFVRGLNGLMTVISLHFHSSRLVAGTDFAEEDLEGLEWTYLRKRWYWFHLWMYFYLKMLINPNLYRNPLIPPQVLCISTKFPFTVFWLQDMFHWTPPCVNVSLWSFKWGSQPPTPCGCWALLKSASRVFCCLLFPWRVVWRNLYIKGRGYFGRGWIAWKCWRGTEWK